MTGRMQVEAEAAQRFHDYIGSLEMFANVVKMAGPGMLHVLRNEGVVFKGEGGQWEKTAFLLYTTLAGLSEDARRLLGEAPAESSEPEQSSHVTPTLPLGEG